MICIAALCIISCIFDISGHPSFVLPSLRSLLRELLPADLLKTHSSSEWKKAILQQYTQDAGESRGMWQILRSCSGLTVSRAVYIYATHSTTLRITAIRDITWRLLFTPSYRSTEYCYWIMNYKIFQPFQCISSL